MNVVHHTPDDKHTQAIAVVCTRRSFQWILGGGIVLSFVLGFIYLIFLNQLATRGFVLEEMKSERMQIQQTREEWDIAISIPLSLYALQSSEQVQEMAAIEKRSYLHVSNEGVAMID